jgi:hypothetical protein
MLGPVVIPLLASPLGVTFREDDDDTENVLIVGSTLFLSTTRLGMKRGTTVDGQNDAIFPAIIHILTTNNTGEDLSFIFVMLLSWSM